MSSRVARKPINIPAGVEVRVSEKAITLKGPKGEIIQDKPSQIEVKVEDKQIQVSVGQAFENADAIAGTIRALLNNHIQGVGQGFIKKLQLVGVGYRVQVGKAKDGRHTLNLTLGLSHPVTYIARKGIELTSASVTEVEVAGINKQEVGQVAAEIRGICKGIRKPEPYKGKGIRYADEVVILKEAKKK